MFIGICIKVTNLSLVFLSPKAAGKLWYNKFYRFVRFSSLAAARRYARFVRKYAKATPRQISNTHSNNVQTFHREARPISQPERAVVSASRHRSTLIIYPRIFCNTRQSFSQRSIFRAFPFPFPSRLSCSRLSRCRERPETLWNRSCPCFKEESSPRVLRIFILFCTKRNSDTRIQRNLLAFRAVVLFGSSRPPNGGQLVSRTVSTRALHGFWPRFRIALVFSITRSLSPARHIKCVATRSLIATGSDGRSDSIVN